MTTTTFSRPTTSIATRSSRRAVWATGLVSGAAAAVVTTATAVVADAAGHPLLADGEEIPALGFAQMTVLGAILGVVIALVLRRRSTRPRRTFLAVTTGLTLLSCIPSVAMGAGDGGANAVVLVATHVVAAAIIVPALLRRL